MPVPVGRRVVTLTGTLEALLADPAHERFVDHWVAARLTDDTVQTQPMERLRARFPHAVSLRYDDPRTGAIVDFGSDGPPVEERIRRVGRPRIPGGGPGPGTVGLRAPPRARRPGRGAPRGTGVRPLALRLQAFGSYAGAFAIDFARLGRHGVFSITGPTGAGKSTIFDAIVYALYDDLPGFRVNSHVRSQYADAAAPAPRSPSSSRPRGATGS